MKILSILLTFMVAVGLIYLTLTFTSVVLTLVLLMIVIGVVLDITKTLLKLLWKLSPYILIAFLLLWLI